MEKIIIDLEAKTDKAIKGIDQVAKEVQDLNKSVVETNKDTAKSLKGVEKASKSASKGIKAISASLKAAGIGLAIAALTSLKDLFSQNQAVVDVFSVAFETAGQIVGQVATAFKDIYNALTETNGQFDAMGKVIGGLTTIYITPLKLAFYGIKLAVQEAMLAWEESFLGDKDPETIKNLNLSILETKENIVETGEAALQAGKDVANNFGEAFTEVVDGSKVIIKELGEVSIATAYETAKANNELQKSAEVAAARQGLIFEKFDRQAEKLRQIRDEERNSIADRKKANDELLVEIDKAEKSSLAQAQTQLAIANANLAKDKENVEFKVAQIEAQRELAAVEAQFEGIRSEQKSNDLALSKELLELDNTRAESQSRIATEKKKFNAEQIEDELLKLEKLKEIETLEQEQEQIRLQGIIDSANAETQAKIDAQIALDEFNEQSRQTNLTRDKEIAAAKKKIAKSEADAKSKTLGDTGKALGQLSEIAGEETAAGKALGIASATINTYRGVSDALAATTVTPFGTALKFVNAAAILSSGLKNVKKIVSVKIPKAKSIGGSVPAGGGVGSAPTSQPPAFNVVGAGSTNQLAEAIGGQSQQPIKTYVVANDVTTSQSLDRNIVDGASI